MGARRGEEISQEGGEPTIAGGITYRLLAGETECADEANEY